MQLNFRNLTEILNLVASAAVLVGLVFLIVEIRQTNQIALRDSRADIVNSGIQVNGFLLENPDLTALLLKLRDPAPELTELEKEQAMLLAVSRFSFWTNINVGAETGLLPNMNLEAYLGAIRQYFDNYPGFAPYFEGILVGSNIKAGDFSRIFDVLLEEVEARK